MISRLQRAASFSAAGLLLASCIPIPYKPQATAFADASLAMSVNHVVSALPDPMTVALAKKIEARDAAITVVSLGEIAELAFPDGDSTVGQLAGPERRNRLCGEAGLAYLVLVGELTSRELRSHGGYMPLLGAGTSTEATGLSAGIIDLRQGQSLANVSAVATGRTSGVIYGFYGIILTPMSGASVRDAVAVAAADAIRDAAGAGPVRIAIARVIGLQSSTCTGDEGCGSDQRCPEGGCGEGGAGQQEDSPPR